MQQLTGMDTSFLAFETANSTGHVGGLIGSRELMPDIDKLAGYLPEELALLAEAAEKRAAGPAEP